MTDDRPTDYYEALQISPNAEPDTIHRVYRLLAQRFHPDNAETGDPGRFRQISEAYAVLSDPEQRARYDLTHEQIRRERMRVVNEGAKARTEFEIEQMVRLTVLEALYTRRRVESQSPGLTLLDLESMIGRPREQLEFTVWYLAAKKYVTRDDNSRLVITADGAEFIEQNYEHTLQRKRLRAAADGT